MIYVFGQIIDKFFIKPIFDQKQTIGEIFDSLIFYANIYANPYTNGDRTKYDSANKKFRELASLLVVKTELIPGYNFLSRINITIPRNNISKVHTELIRLSNSLYSSPTQSGNAGVLNSEGADSIKKYLKSKF